MAKITNPSKLLPAAKSSAITKVGKSGLISPININKKSAALVKSNDVGGKLVNIEKFLKSDLIVSKKKAEVKRKEKEKQDFDEAEKKLELPKLKGFSLPKISLPSIGLFERVKRFLFFTALGWLLPRILDILPKLEGFGRTIVKVYQFAEGMFGKLFDGFMTFMKFSGDLKNKTIGFIAQAKAGVGGDYNTEFKKLENQFNNFVNASIIAGVLAADVGLSVIDEYNRLRNRGPGGKLGASVAGSRFRDVGRELGDRKAGYVDEGRYRAKGQARAGGFALAQARKTATQTSIKPTKPPSWWDKIFKGPFAKLKGPLTRFAGVAVPGLGAAVGAADAAARFKAGDKIGGVLASVSAALDAATAAAALTGIGLPVAGILGTISIGIDVILLIRDILRIIPGIPEKLLGFYKGGRVLRRYQGGGTTRGGRPVGGAPRRTFTPARKRKPSRIPIPKVQPGRDVGGEKKVKDFYGEPDPTDENLLLKKGTSSLLLGQEPSPFKTLKKMSGTLKSDETLAKGILGLMSAGIDMALGQKPDKKVLKSFFDVIGYVSDTLASQRANMSMSSLTSQLRGFAEGGTVPSRQLRRTQDITTGDTLAKLIGPAIDQKINETMQNIQKELQLKKEGAGPGAGPGGGPGGGPSGGELPLYGGPGIEGLSDFIAKAETGGRWNAYNNDWKDGKRGDDTILTLKLSELRSYMNRNHPNSSGAVGAYQFMPETAISYARQLGFDPNKTVFSPEIQRKLNIQHLRDLGYDDYVSGKITRNEFGRRIAQQYRAVPDPNTGYTYSDSASSRNKATVSLDEYNKALDNAKQKAVAVTPQAMVIGGIKPSEIYLSGRQGMRQHPITGEWKMHKGIDLVGRDGSPISSAQDAKVVFAGDTGGGYGNEVVLRYSNGAETRFAHLKSINVKTGQTIKAGQLIGRQGSTGRSTNSHLHFEYYPSGNAMTYQGYGDAFSVKDSYFRYGGNVKPKVEEKPLSPSSPPGQPPSPSQQPRQGSGGRPSTAEQLRQRGIPVQGKLQGGGFIAPSRPNRPIPNSFASYETPGGGMRIAIQPMIQYIEKPSSSKSIDFPMIIPIPVNSSMPDLSLSRG